MIFVCELVFGDGYLQASHHTVLCLPIVKQYETHWASSLRTIGPRPFTAGTTRRCECWQSQAASFAGNAGRYSYLRLSEVFPGSRAEHSTRALRVDCFDCEKIYWSEALSNLLLRCEIGRLRPHWVVTPQSHPGHKIVRGSTHRTRFTRGAQFDLNIGCLCLMDLSYLRILGVPQGTKQSCLEFGERLRTSPSANAPGGRFVRESEKALLLISRVLPARLPSLPRKDMWSFVTIKPLGNSSARLSKN